MREYDGQNPSSDRLDRIGARTAASEHDSLSLRPHLCTFSGRVILPCNHLVLLVWHSDDQQKKDTFSPQPPPKSILISVTRVPGSIHMRSGNPPIPPGASSTSAAHSACLRPVPTSSQVQRQRPGQRLAAKGCRQEERGPSLIRRSPSPLPDHQQGRQPRHWIQRAILNDIVRRVTRPPPCFFSSSLHTRPTTAPCRSHGPSCDAVCLGGRMHSGKKKRKGKRASGAIAKSLSFRASCLTDGGCPRQNS
ncbi:uncharacterized protein LY79DRAFT_355976 [Colletotrichum navitas]|uniref:Uncharacterized protein n=1 Tax=Colletotrichum navitas TaxID=681940 RepID=A0AAD8Q852_9PEZI|nr:uncharacterized protein LY79DRAFT_355976 [Colletotrichum navitas]KAK1597773.1 hypothetical protein LY79DRAFT_355976 [Colletotrichum navitas]